ncbi:flagella-associated protein [Holotrichia oblita]|uniref:Flagella-associated protein n=1 Tax=Holotrichia oblita TaxID=644536 RepID=A0ACB9T5X3_HOLOL|nr:flagella-associated protein [Holotrichia oblita]
MSGQWDLQNSEHAKVALNCFYGLPDGEENSEEEADEEADKEFENLELLHYRSDSDSNKPNLSSTSCNDEFNDDFIRVSLSPTPESGPDLIIGNEFSTPTRRVEFLKDEIELDNPDFIDLNLSKLELYIMRRWGNSAELPLNSNLPDNVPNINNLSKRINEYFTSEVKEDSQTSEKLQEVSKMAENLTPENSEQIVTSEERVTHGRYAPKRYVTTCYFQPKQLPVWYSETMILNIGSTKKKYFESIYYENKLSPFHWTESMTTIIPDSEEPIRVNSTVDIPISQPEFYYISLEPQQTAAMAK